MVNIKYMVDKCHKFGVKILLISGLDFGFSPQQYC